MRIQSLDRDAARAAFTSAFVLGRAFGHGWTFRFAGDEGAAWQAWQEETPASWQAALDATMGDDWGSACIGEPRVRHETGSRSISWEIDEDGAVRLSAHPRFGQITIEIFRSRRGTTVAMPEEGCQIALRDLLVAKGDWQKNGWAHERSGALRTILALRRAVEALAGQEEFWRLVRIYGERPDGRIGKCLQASGNSTSWGEQPHWSEQA